MIPTTLKKATLKKLILDTCTKTTFMYNNTFYDQTDGVSMGGSLGPLLANIIMVELEDVVIRKLINSGTIKFYTRFVDDTLLLIKREDVDRVKIEFEKFDKNLKFTYDLFENKNPHFLDIEITPAGLKIFRKDTFTGHYTDFSSFVPWSHRISWMRSLVYRTKRICDKDLFKRGIREIKDFASWNGFPRKIRNTLINKFVKSTENTKPNENNTSPDENCVWFELPYIGPTGEFLAKMFKQKISRLLNPNKKVNIKTRFKTTHLSMFAPTKDKVPMLNKSNVVYEMKCPGCGDKYIGKTERTLFERTKEHAWTDIESPLRNHLIECEHFLHMFGMLSMNRHLFDDDISDNESFLRDFSIASVRQNVKILEIDNNWNRLLYKESLFIERVNPALNSGLKASRMLQLFK